MKTQNPSFGYSFPTIRGIQAGREYYVSMCPLKLLPKIFAFDKVDLTPEMRAQRILNKGRIPALAKYITQNRKDYVFSAITASINSIVKFTPFGEGGDLHKMGTLSVPLDAKFIINDGQHRRAAIEMALLESPELGNETIAVVFFLDVGLKRCQQMFADLNRFSIRPSKSIGVLYDQRDEKAAMAKVIALKSDTFKSLVELEKSTLSPRSSKLFTLSAIYHATEALILNWNIKNTEEVAALATEYWEEIAKGFPEWTQVREKKMSAGEVRKDFIHSHGIVMQALGRVGNELIRNHRKDWKIKIKDISTIDWKRANTKLWEGRAMIGGRVSKSEQNVTLTTAAIKRHLKLPLSAEEKHMETLVKRGSNG